MSVVGRSRLFQPSRVVATSLIFMFIAIAPALLQSSGSGVLLSIPFELPDQGGTAYVSLFDGDTLEGAVERFFNEYDLGRTYHHPVLNEVKRRAMKARIVPVLSVPLAPAEGQKVAFTVDLFDGDEVAVKARQVAETNKLPAADVDAVVDAVVKKAVDVGLLPVMTVDVQLPAPAAKEGSGSGSGPAAAAATEVLALYRGDNLTQVVAAFSATHGLTGSDKERVQETVEKYARARGLLPVMTLNAMLQPLGSSSPVPVRVEFMDGDDLDETITAYAERFKLSEASAGDLRRAAHARALELRLLPVLAIPADLNGKNVSIQLYQGDLPGQAIDRFIEDNKLNMTSADKSSLEGEVRRAAMDARLYPALELEVSVPSGAAVPFRLYRGDHVDQLVEDFAKAHGLEASDKAVLYASVKERAAQRGLVPAMVIPVSIDGEQHSLELFRGDNITEVVRRFSAGLKLDGAQEGQLERAVLQRATAERMVPAMVLAISVRGKRVPLHFYEGDTADSVVSRFSDANGLDPEETEEVRRAVTVKVQQSRLAPVLSVPVTVEDETGAAAPRELVFDLYEGDSLVDSAGKFIKAHGLDFSVEEFVAMVQEQGRGAGEERHTEL